MSRHTKPRRPHRRQSNQVEDNTTAFRAFAASDPLMQQIAEHFNPEDAAAEDAAAENDRQFFERYPAIRFRRRPPLGSEGRAATPPGQHLVAVIACQIGPGLRARKLIFAPLPPEGARH